LASAIDKGEKVTESAKETVGAGAKEASEKTKEGAEMAKQKGNQVCFAFWSSSSPHLCVTGCCWCYTSQRRLQEGGEEVDSFIDCTIILI